MTQSRGPERSLKWRHRLGILSAAFGGLDSIKGLCRQRLFIFLFPLLLSAPFLNRAYFVDDSYFVEIATWLKESPQLPYHFRADDAGPQTRGIEEDGFVRMVNPLAHQYYLALLLKLGGEREWFLRLGCVLLACFSALFIFELARRWVKHSLLATLLTLVTPVFWCTSYSLLIDGTLGFFFFGAFLFFIWAIERERTFWFLLSGVFMGLAILTKYPGLLILPLTGWYILLTKRSFIFKASLAWFVALAFLLAYNLWTFHLYGVAHIGGASNRMVSSYGWAKYFVFFIFFSGASLVPLICWVFVGRLGIVLSVITMMISTLFLMSPWGGFTFLQSVLISGWLVTSFHFIASFKVLFHHRDRLPDLIIAAWIFGYIAMMHFVMSWVAVRYYMIVIPALVFWCIRLVEIHTPALARQVLCAGLILLMAFTSMICYADYRQAECARQIGPRLVADGFVGGPRSFFLGDSFISSYLKRYGWVPCFPDTQFEPGDLILSKEVTMPSIWFLKKQHPVRLVKTWDNPSYFPLRVMDNQGSAGFYASVWGALPFTFSQSPWERFRLFEVLAPINNNDAQR